VFDGTHTAATVKAATGMSDDDNDVPVIRWNASNKSSRHSDVFSLARSHKCTSGDIAMSSLWRGLISVPDVEFGSIRFTNRVQT
jgi:hypothetical protein